MKFSRFLPGAVASYIEAGRGEDCWVFQHIPKTAGSSIAAELSENRPPYRNFDFAAQGRSPNRTEYLQQLTEDLSGAVARGTLRSASGHFRHSHMELILQAHPKLKLFTFVRDPVSRLVSHYQYSRSPDHFASAQFRERFPTFEDFVNAPLQCNFMTQFICGESDVEPQELIRYAFERYAFIGSLGSYALSFRLLSGLLWKPALPNRHERAGNGSFSKRDLSTDLLKTIRKRNRTDRALYKAVTEAYRACRGELQRELRRRAEPVERSLQSG